ncbi:hypothetical protein, partial [Acetobacter ghanensis]|uniref:hypothetical protein n=1 Tax=Acetobacter ghanensis TaxID=431306 RepID=UPI00223275B6
MNETGRYGPFLFCVWNINFQDWRFSGVFCLGYDFVSFFRLWGVDGGVLVGIEAASPRRSDLG